MNDARDLTRATAIDLLAPEADALVGERYRHTDTS